MSGSEDNPGVATPAESILTEAAHTVRSQKTIDTSGATLRTSKCTIRFGGLVAVNTLDMEVHQGEIFGLIGPNGAGKTTIFNLLTGVYEPTEGEILFDNQSVVGRRPYHITEHGIA